VTTHQELIAAEQKALGMTHADVAQILTEQWKFPPILATPISSSHNPQSVSDPALRRLAEVVELAGVCAEVFVNTSAVQAIADVRALCVGRYKMAAADCDALLAEISTRSKEVAGLIEINIGTQISYEKILQQANEQLAEMALQAQQGNSQLQEQNQQLKVQATTDALTGLANRATFDAFFKESFARISEGVSLTLLMMDLDKFKSINDTYGHPAGDAVLKAVAGIVKSAARMQDLAARYGGEEMILVLPSTPKATAAIIADTIRRSIMAKKIFTDEATVNVTVSIGVATAEPGGPLTSPAHLLKAADMAVYAAKHGGRNCVKVFALPKTAAA
jgi:diguanylate cyclase (GGDEF)-like protein